MADKTGSNKRTEVRDHDIRVTPAGIARRADLVSQLYQTTSYDEMPTDFMRRTEGDSDDDD